ncbi:hypothetical protein BG006_001713 [Podila minutissima]|uniref:Uncharacterized protein n=1 Tax=Podila minutissima TaxID=64525 RepID=A0A9P5SCU1_9FUNG|nr:hypothetical protein BG006_001713 [Podila minutissima]
MHFTTILLTVAATLALTTVQGTSPRPAVNQTAANLKVMNYALALEHLEAAFYKQGLAKFNSSAFSDAGYEGLVRNRLALIGQHGNWHVIALSNAITKLKGTPVRPCNYTFPLANVTTFLTAARALENTGVSAYLGAVSGLRGGMFTVEASVLTVKARQASYLNGLWNQTGFPYARDTPLTPRQVATLTSKFIKSCPYNITVKPFTQLTATLPANGTGNITTSFRGRRSNETSLYCQLRYGAKIAVSTRNNCTLPADAIGYIYVLVTDTKTPITARNENRIVAGPALLFNDNRNNSVPAPTTNTIPFPTSTTISTTISTTTTDITTMTSMTSPTMISVTPMPSPTTVG